MHVVPKAKVAAALAASAAAAEPAPPILGTPVPADEEKTTLEAQWEEEEASTTVDQGGVAERIRDLNLDAPMARGLGVTGTGTGSVIEEPTVDDGKSPEMVLPPGAARMVITAGADDGKLFDIDGHKAYSIGRALDNDIVLSDIAVSRKHFELRFEDGAWVIVDNSSGNGTVVNGNLEDNPFMLANGDAIEIGNTTFRFEQHAIEVPRSHAAPETFDVDLDDEDEPSTVAGKKFDTTPQPYAPPLRPKTLPPPMPARTRSTTQPPQPFSLPPAPMPGMGAIPASAMPLPQMAHRAPLGQQMTALSPPGAQPSFVSTAPLGSRQSNPAVNGIPLNSGPPQHISASMSAAITNAPVGSNPMTAMHGPPMGQQMNVMHAIVAPSAAPTLLGDPRAMGTTIPGQGPPAPMPQQLYYPQASEIPPHSVHMLVVQAQNARRDGSTSQVPHAAFSAAQPIPLRFMPPTLSRRARIGIALGAITLFATITTIAIAHSGSGGKAKPASTASAPTTPKVATPAPAPAPKIAMPTPTPTPTSTPIAPTTPPPAPKVATVTPPPPAPKPEPKPDRTVVSARRPDPKPDPVPEPKPEPKPEIKSHEESGAHATSLTSNGGGTSASTRLVATGEDPKEKADKLYRDKHFADAAGVLTAAARSADGETAKDYKLRASRYQALARFYNQGMAPGAEPDDAFDALRSALTFDQNSGGEFQGEISDRLKLVVARATASFLASQEFEKAHTAVQTADQLGVSTNTIKSAKKKLEEQASTLYSSAHTDGFSSASGK
ncbi:MAG TPA: FHA domain-containing protein, partial [Kofleriaceae bacterium]